MEDWMERVRTILDETPTRAMPYSRVLLALRESGMPVSGREGWILGRVADQSEYFRVISGRLGPWTLLSDLRGPEASPLPSPVYSTQPWILAWASNTPPAGEEGKALGRVRESIQAWGRALDEGSQTAVARWIGAVKEAERAMDRCIKAGVGKA